MLHATPVASNSAHLTQLPTCPLVCKIIAGTRGKYVTSGKCAPPKRPTLSCHVYVPPHRVQQLRIAEDNCLWRPECTHSEYCKLYTPDSHISCICCPRCRASACCCKYSHICFMVCSAFSRHGVIPECICQHSIAQSSERHCEGKMCGKERHKVDV